MLNARTVHKKGAVIYSIGADVQQLSTAVCAELAPSGPNKGCQPGGKKGRISRIDGRRAPITGEELFLSLGCGHTVAFCKVASLGGLTPTKIIQDTKGCLDYPQAPQSESI